MFRDSVSPFLAASFPLFLVATASSRDFQPIPNRSRREIMSASPLPLRKSINANLTSDFPADYLDDEITRSRISDSVLQPSRDRVFSFFFFFSIPRKFSISRNRFVRNCVTYHKKYTMRAG